MCLRFRFDFVGIASRQTRHKKFLILFGTRNPHMLLHRIVSPFCSTTCLGSSSSIFKNRYPDLQEYWPFWVHGQNSLSSVGCFERGIFLMSSASSGANKPAIRSSFQVRFSSSIRTSTVVSSQPSRIGDMARVGGFDGSQVCCHI